MLKVSELYIPIWLYSNWSINQVSNIWDILYIPPLCQVLDTYFFQISNQLFLLYFNFKIGFFKSLFIRSAYTTWSTTSDIVVILCPASLEDAPQWYILCLSVFQSMIIYLSWNSPPDFWNFIFLNGYSLQKSWYSRVWSPLPTLSLNIVISTDEGISFSSTSVLTPI